MTPRSTRGLSTNAAGSISSPPPRTRPRALLPSSKSAKACGKGGDLLSPLPFRGEDMEAWRVAPSRRWRGECTPPLSQPSPLKGRGLMERDNENSCHRTRKTGPRDGSEPREGGARGPSLRPQQQGAPPTRVSGLTSRTDERRKK